MNIIGILRIKNEARWIRRVIQSLQPLCSAVYVFDDSSTDSTVAEAMAVGAHVIASPFQDFNETRDKNYMLAQIPTQDADWVVMIDGDEILAPGSQDAIQMAIRDQGGICDAFTFEVLYLWNDEQHIRTDLRTFCRRRASMFRPQRGMTFVCQANYRKHGLHCGNVPANYNAMPCGARLLHLGYMHREDRLRKHAWYNQLDPGNGMEDFYNHMIIGDTPELPAESVTKWGGPLKLEAL